MIWNAENAAESLRTTLTRCRDLPTDDIEHLTAMIDDGRTDAAFITACHQLHDQEAVIDHRTRSTLEDVGRFYGLDAHLWDALPRH